MQIRLAYGKSGLIVNFPDDVDVISPKFVAGLADETSALREAL